MIKVVHLLHGLSMGGAETLVKDYSLLFDKKIIDLVIVCLNRKNLPYEKLLESNGITVIYASDFMPFYSKNGILAQTINKIQRYIVVKKILRKINPDIVHTHLNVNIYLKYSKPRKNTAIFYTHHYMPRFWQEQYLSDYKAMQWIVRHYSTNILALTDTMKQELEYMFPKTPIIVVNNGIFVERFNHEAFDNVKKKELNIPDDAVVIGHVGRFNVSLKNQLFLIDVFGKILEKEEKAWLLLVGKGKDEQLIRDKLDALSIKRFSILKDRTDIPELMRIMDVFLFPALHEALGIVLIEAQFSGLKCIVSENVAQSAIISNYVERIHLAEGKDIWANKALEMIHTHTRKELYKPEEWDISYIVKQIEKMYEKSVHSN